MLTETTALLPVMRSAPGWPLFSVPPLRLKVALKKSTKFVDAVACSAPPLSVPPLLKMIVLPDVGEFASVVPADCVYVTSKRNPDPPALFFTVPVLVKRLMPTPSVSMEPSLWMSSVPVLLNTELLSRLIGCVTADIVALPALSMACVVIDRAADSVSMSNVVPEVMMVWPAPASVPPVHLNVAGELMVNAAGVVSVPPFNCRLVLLMVMAALVATFPASMVTLPPLNVVPGAHVYVCADGTGNHTSVPAAIVHAAVLRPSPSNARTPPLIVTPLAP